MVAQPPSTTYFIIDATRARFTPSLSLKDLPGAGQRIDVICRAALAALWWGDMLLRHVTFIAAFKPLSALYIEGCRLTEENFPKTELRLARLLREIYTCRVNVTGISFTEKTIGEIIHDMQVAAIQVWWLDEGGVQNDDLFKINHTAAYILGDHLGMSEEFRAEFATSLPKVSLGPKSYLGSACIQFILAKQNFLPHNSFP